MVQRIYKFYKCYSIIIFFVIELLFVNCKGGEMIPCCMDKPISVTTEMVELARIEKQPTLTYVLQVFFDHPTALISSINNPLFPAMCSDALQQATILQSQSIITVLLSRGLDINAIASDGMRPLHMAIFSNNQEFFKFLLTQKNINLNALDIEGNTPLHIVVTTDFYNICKILLSYSHKFDVNAQNRDGFTALHMAVLNHVKMVKPLLKSLTININLPGQGGNTPLHLAVGWEDLKTLELLLNRKDILIDAPNNKWETPIHLAVLKDDERVVKRLLEAGVDVNKQDRDGNTPLHLAFARKSWKIIVCLKNKGASTTIRNQAGELPSDMIPPVVPLLVSSFPRWEFNKRMATNSSISAKTVQNTCKPGHDKYANGEEVKQNLFKLPDKKIYWPDSGSNKRVRPAVESSSDNNSVAITDQYIYESEAKRVKLAPQHELANQLSLEIPSQDDLQTEIPGFQ